MCHVVHISHKAHDWIHPLFLSSLVIQCGVIYNPRKTSDEPGFKSAIIWTKYSEIPLQWKAVIVMVNTFVKVCGQFVPVSWHLHCGQNNVLTSFPSWQETDKYCWMSFPDCIRDGPMFPNWILQQVPSLVCHVWLGIIMAENHTVARQRRTVSPDCLLQVFSVAQYLSKLTLCIHSRKTDSNTHDKSQKTVASTLPADGAICSKVTHLSVWTSSSTRAIATSIITHFGYCPSHCPCQMRMLGTIWQPVAWTLNHLHTLPYVVNEYQLPTFSVPTKRV